MSNIYTNIAKKRAEQSQEAAHMQQKATDSQSVVPPPSNTPLSTKIASSPKEAKKPTKPQNRLSTNPFPTHDGAEKVEKYTTHIFPSFTKKIKHFAVENEMKDYEVVNNALKDYFGKHQ